MAGRQVMAPNRFPMYLFKIAAKTLNMTEVMRPEHSRLAARVISPATRPASPEAEASGGRKQQGLSPGGG